MVGLLTLLAPLALSSALAGTQAGKAYDAELSGYNYPFPVKNFEIQDQRQLLKMAYMDVAPPEHANGQVVVLLHGKNFGGFYWEPTIRSLLSHGYRVIVPDQIGFGKSSKPDRYQFTFQTLAATTHALLVSLKIDHANVVGHSMGGMLAVRYTLMYPTMVDRLVLVDPLGLEDWKLVVPYRGIDEAFQAELKATRDSIREYQKKAYYDGKWKPEYEALIEAQAGWTLHPDFPKVAWNAALTSEMIYTQPVIYEFPHIASPTLLMIGQRDRTAPGRNLATKEVAETLGDYPKIGREAASRIPGAKLVEIEGAGHLPQVEKFDVYERALLDFLKLSDKRKPSSVGDDVDASSTYALNPGDLPDATALRRWRDPKFEDTNAPAVTTLEHLEIPGSCRNQNLYPTHPQQSTKIYHLYRDGIYELTKLSAESRTCKITSQPSGREKKFCLLADDFEHVVLSDTFQDACGNFYRGVWKVDFLRRDDNMGTLLSKGRTVYTDDHSNFEGQVYVGQTYAVERKDFLFLAPIFGGDRDKLNQLKLEAIRNTHTYNSETHLFQNLPQKK